jgi:hypothetical protein
MHIFFVVLFIIGFTALFYFGGKLFASKTSPTIVGTPTTPNAQTESVAAANAALVPTSEFTVLEAKFKAEVLKLEEEFFAEVTKLKAKL